MLKITRPDLFEDLLLFVELEAVITQTFDYYLLQVIHVKCAVTFHILILSLKRGFIKAMN